LYRNDPFFPNALPVVWRLMPKNELSDFLLVHQIPYRIKNTLYQAQILSLYFGGSGELTPKLNGLSVAGT